ncbi:phosphatidylserine synthase [Nonlabens sp. YIK11]|uniref:CDP-alcohol phosphatidyltransferase family protein n=1 Tax=Nonlabens sp. YIK11 TaxID=1453349 RepID=UPI0006DC7290|nr:CDP-alcohol phosphatidyltransferase family protein [Nonlabens sp. YIK11]KQC34119.1 phosphatidylserine synthase [Nonlabens sp. YIK11]
MKQWIPNIITLLNLLCGCIAAVFALNDDLITAGILVAAGIFFDFFDGLAARMLKVSSELGGQLDSMADLVTSGLVPGIAMYQMLNDSLGVNLFEDSLSFQSATGDYAIAHPFLPLIGFLITAASALRLARFNLDTRQTDSFIGVPTPANAILIISLAIIVQSTHVDWIYGLLSNPYILTGIILLSCYLLNAELPLFALKFKNFGFKGNEIRWIFLLICLVLIATLQLYAVPCIIVLYIAMSLLNNTILDKKRA